MYRYNAAEEKAAIALVPGAAEGGSFTDMSAEAAEAKEKDALHAAAAADRHAEAAAGAGGTGGGRPFNEDDDTAAAAASDDPNAEAVRVRVCDLPLSSRSRPRPGSSPGSGPGTGSRSLQAVERVMLAGFSSEGVLGSITNVHLLVADREVGSHSLPGVVRLVTYWSILVVVIN